MADISRELEAILAAIYGEEVRGSIHDAIDKINTVNEESVSTINEMYSLVASELSFAASDISALIVSITMTEKDVIETNIPSGSYRGPFSIPIDVSQLSFYGDLSILNALYNETVVSDYYIVPILIYNKRLHVLNELGSSVPALFYGDVWNNGPFCTDGFDTSGVKITIEDFDVRISSNNNVLIEGTLSKIGNNTYASLSLQGNVTLMYLKIPRGINAYEPNIDTPLYIDSTLVEPVPLKEKVASLHIGNESSYFSKIPYYHFHIGSDDTYFTAVFPFELLAGNSYSINFSISDMNSSGEGCVYRIVLYDVTERNNYITLYDTDEVKAKELTFYKECTIHIPEQQVIAESNRKYQLRLRLKNGASADDIELVNTGIFVHIEARYKKRSDISIDRGEGRSSIIENDLANNKASGDFSHAEGSGTEATKQYSHAEGENSKSSGNSSHAEGSGTTASGDFSHAEGFNTDASGRTSHAEGEYPTASGIASHAEGYDTYASGTASHSEGFRTSSSGRTSHAEGNNTVAASECQHVSGKYNIVDTENKYAEIIGNGTGDTNRSNARSLDWEGNETLAGDLYLGPNKKSVLNSLSSVINLSSGSIASFTDGADDIPVKDLTFHISPIQDLHGYDHPWPEGGGKNMLKVTATTQTINGITFTVNDDGTIVVNGTATADATLRLFDGTGDFINCIISGCPSGGTTSTYYAALSNVTITSLVDVGTERVITIENTGRWIYNITIKNGYTANNLVFKPMIRLASETDATFAPHSNICPISGWTGANVTRTGKNVCDWKINTTNEALRIHLMPNTYHLEASAPITEGNWYVRMTDASGAYFDKADMGLGGWQMTSSRWAYGGASSTGVTFIVPIGCALVEIGKLYSDGTIPVMLSIGSAVVPYEPYSGTTIPISWQTEAGTVYGGTLDVTTGVLTRTMAEVDLGTLTWTGVIIASGFYKTSEIQDVKYVASNTELGNGVAEKYAMHTGSGMSTATGCIAIDVDAVFVNSGQAGVTPTGSFVYELATPQTYQLDPTEVKSILGLNNVWADCGETEVEYRADTKLYIDGKIAELQALILENGGN